MKQTAVRWLELVLIWDPISEEDFEHNINCWKKAKEMEKEQIGYTKEDVLKAGEMGEINHHDTKHIVSYLDEAKQYNETFNIIEK